MTGPNSTWLKDPTAILDWNFDWTDWLSAGETLLTATFTATAGITVTSSSFTTTVGTVWLSGGNPGTPYLVTCHVTTSAGRADDRSITIRVQNR